MPFTEDVRLALEDIVGPEWVQTDPAVTTCYSRTFGPLPLQRAPAAVVMPGSTEEIQEIFRAANRLKFRVIPTGTMFFFTCIPQGFDYINIDPKRMNYFEIDEKNMYAVVDPYVTFTQLQTEAMKRGLICYIPGAGSQVSVLANLVFQGAGLHGYRLGAGSRSMLAMEWVMPDGEIFRTGSLATSDKYFWGEGPGPDLRGMMKGLWGHLGGMGMCTRIGIKLHPWNGPGVLPVKGVSPDKRGDFSHDMFRFFMITYPDMQSAINAMYEVGKNEIGWKCTFYASAVLNFIPSLSAEEMWNGSDMNVFRDALDRCLLVMLEGHIGGKAQLDYEESVLREIVDETNGKFLPKPFNDWWAEHFIPELIRCNLINRIFRPGANFVALKESAECLDHCVKVHEGGLPKIREFVRDNPNFIDCGGEGMWVNVYDLCHGANAENAIVPITQMGLIQGLQFVYELTKDDIEAGLHTDFTILDPLLELIGPGMLNFDRFIRYTKAEFDPNDISNPPFPMKAEKLEVED